MRFWRNSLNIHVPITMLELEFDQLVRHAKPVNKFIPIPKYPPVIEDFSFIVTPEFRVGPFIEVISKIHTLIRSVTLLDAYENKRTFRVTYLTPRARSPTSISRLCIRNFWNTPPKNSASPR